MDQNNKNHAFYFNDSSRESCLRWEHGEDVVYK